MAAILDSTGYTGFRLMSIPAAAAGTPVPLLPHYGITNPAVHAAGSDVRCRRLLITRYHVQYDYSPSALLKPLFSMLIIFDFLK